MQSVFNESSQPINAISGRHLFRKRNSNVKVLLVEENSYTKFLPTKNCFLFVNLIEFNLQAKTLTSLTRSEFLSCKYVVTVRILNSQISYLPEDLFYDLRNLEYLEITGSRLMAFPKNMFAKNTRIETVILDNNKLLSVDSEYPTTVKVLSMKGNICVDKDFPGDYLTLQDFSSSLNETCSKKNLEEFVTNYKFQITQMANLTADVRNMKSKLESSIEESNRCGKNVTSLIDMTQVCESEIQTLSSNHTEAQKKIQQLYTDIVSLHQNISEIRFELDDKTLELARCQTEQENLNETFGNLVEHLTILTDNQNENEGKIKDLNILLATVESSCNSTIDEMTSQLSEADNNKTNYEETINEMSTKMFELELNLTESYDNCSALIFQLTSELNVTSQKLQLRDLELKEFQLRNESLEIQGDIYNQTDLEEHFEIESSSISKMRHDVVVVPCLVILMIFGWVTSLILFIKLKKDSKHNEIQLSVY
ncbi:CLUMA_CG016022, isoform A [Clunio marinus]|uniref:CLUMA_CG016022, isoform A n=1 Tax=Clunio marinus TaxID=568069 RepID=A0A1J1ITP0_9DIPT|nr:CLUMA_CG016022, isoform A [Clunio marinus]